MEIKFNVKDEKLFFSMLSVYGTYAEFAEALEKENIEPPYSYIDVIINYLANYSEEHNLYETNANVENIYGVISFCLGTGNYTLTGDLLKLFDKSPTPNSYFKLDKDTLWLNLVETGLSL